MRRTITVVVGLLLPAVLAVAAEPDPQVQAALDSTYAELTSSTGQDYAKARDRLRSMDGETVKTYLETKRLATADVVSQLCLDGLLLRLEDEARLETALQKALTGAAEDQSHLKRNPDSGPTPPRPSAAGALLVRYLGDDALPFVTELLVKDLAKDWEHWKRLGLLKALRSFGWQRKYKGNAKGYEYIKIKDARAGQVLLWLAEHGDDHTMDELDPRTKAKLIRMGTGNYGPIALTAADLLRNFATPELHKQVEAARDRIPSGKRKASLARAARAMASRIREFNLTATHPASQPAASAPATP